MNSQTIYDLGVIGGGSGGFAAALTAAREGLTVLLVEKAPLLGGTMVAARVSVWEPGVGGTGIPFELYKRLKHRQAVGIYSFGRHFSWQDKFYWPHQLDKVNFPGGETVLDLRFRYRDTLRRHIDAGFPLNEAFCRRILHGVVFEPEVMADEMSQQLAGTGRCHVCLNTIFNEVDYSEGRLRSVRLETGELISARSWIDATGDGALCRMCGCRMFRGQDPRNRFNEPSAPEQEIDNVNGASLIYRVMPVEDGRIEPLPSDIPEACWWAPFFPPVFCWQMPAGGWSMNMLPTMRGDEFLGMNYGQALAECRRRVRAHWHFLQTNFPEFKKYRLSEIAPFLGIRETYRVSAEYMLNEHDLRQGLSRQDHPDIIAIADHAVDRHGQESPGLELTEPYGIPFRSLIPKGWRNMLVACRAAGFSALAASSCRLSRTMMQLGQAAGMAAVLARENNQEISSINSRALQARLRQQGVQLEWPLTEKLARYIGEE